MKMRVLLCLVLVLQTVTLFPAASRLLPPNHDTNNQLPGTKVSTQNVQTSDISKQEYEEGRGRGRGGYRGMEQQPGSRPPNCEHKCEGCDPCIASQVPTTTTTTHFGIQFANYEPESWKCKCGPSVYSP